MKTEGVLMDYPMHIVAAAGLFRDDAGRILLVKVPRRGWEMPGGQVEVGEDLDDALVREVLEESDCTVAVERLVGVYTNPAPPSKVVFCFTGRHVSGQPRPGMEAEAAGWFTPDEALAAVTFPANRVRLQDALAAGEGTVYRVYTNRPYQERKARLF